jgi:hypothetical protein
VKKGERIPEALLDRAVSGVNLAPGVLREQMGSDPLLLLFLRHFGCVFCRETLGDVRAIAEQRAAYFPDVLFFFQGSAMEGKAFLRRYWPAARAVADPQGFFYEAFGVERGGVVEMFRPAVWSAQSRAAAKGHRNGDRSGDIWRMPGAFLARGDEILWAHDFRHAGDRPDYEHIGRIALEARQSASSEPDRSREPQPREPLRERA